MLVTSFDRNFLKHLKGDTVILFAKLQRFQYLFLVPDLQNYLREIPGLQLYFHTDLAFAGDRHIEVYNRISKQH